MITIDEIRDLALSFPEAIEEPHFEKVSFRVKKKIFATYDSALKRLCVKLSEVDQSVFCDKDRMVVYPVPNSWGKQGWTLIELKKVHEDLFRDALTTAYCSVAPPRLADQVRPKKVKKQGHPL